MSFLSCFWLLVTLSIVNATVDSSKDLLLVDVIFRHGARTPLFTYPNDPYLSETFDPYGWGQITNEGKDYLYDMGVFLRKRYGDFFNNRYNPDELWAQATSYPRTQVSLQVVLAGLYPPRGTPLQWNRLLNWQPIAYAQEPLEEPNIKIMNVHTPCPRAQEASAEVFEMPEIKEALGEYQKLFEEVSRFTGMPMKTTDDIQWLHGTLLAEEEYGLKLPKWTKKYYPEKLTKLAELSYVYSIYTDELKRLKAGPFIKKMIDQYEQKRNGTLKDLKISLYSAHDTSVAYLLSGLNVWEKQYPTYGIMAMFELVRDKETGEIGVQIYLRKSPRAGAVPLTIPGCDHFCPLDKFVELTRDVVSEDYEALCKPKNKDYVAPSFTSGFKG